MIYIIKTGSFVKIGYTTNVARRLGQLQSANPEPLELIDSIPGTLAVERSIHEKLSPYRSEGGNEWYKLTPEVTEFVNNFRGLGLLRLLEDRQYRQDRKESGSL